MVHIPPLINDLGLILSAAAVTTLLFKFIKQPVVLGYILAGLIVGPYISFTPTVAEEESIKIWAEIGVIFLLFSLGLEFSFKKLVKVGGAASITAIVEVIGMMGFGFVTGKLMGWSNMDSIFLGGILSISSTTIIIRAFDELGIKHKKFVGLVFGALIVEDLAAILLMVLLSTLAVSQQFAGTEMLMSILKLGFFLILWFLGGIFLVPTFLKKTKGLMNDETMLVVSLAFCLLMVVIATHAGFSPALGAFIMGSILAETTQAERIEHLTKSVKDLFAAVFFVSVGMMIDPSILVEYAWPILIVTLVTIVGKFVTTGGGALLSGQSIKTSVQTGMSLSQIGEFSFIIATLGVTLNVTSHFLYPIAVAVSAITTFSTPYLIKFSEPFANFLETRLPPRVIQRINGYSTSAQTISQQSDWKMLIQAYLYKIVIHSVILTSIIFLSSELLFPFMITIFGPDEKTVILTVGISILFMLPFLWALALRRKHNKTYSALWLKGRSSRGPLVLLEAVRIGIAVFFLGILLHLYIETWLALVITVVVIGTVIVVFSSRLQTFYSRLETRFLGNLYERETESAKPEIVPWDGHLAEVSVAPESPLVGQTLTELGIREQYGANIALIERGEQHILSPTGNQRVYPNDKLLLIGTDDQLQKVKELASLKDTTYDNGDGIKEHMELRAVTIKPDSTLLGKTIRSSHMRERTKSLVVGIERNGQRFLNPDPAMTLELNDVVWIVGDKRLISLLDQ